MARNVDEPNVGFRLTTACISSLPFTVAAWVKPAATNKHGVVFGIGDSGSADGNWTIQLRSEGAVWVQTDPTDGGSAVNAEDTPYPTAGQWEHIVGVWDDSPRENRLYRDGTEVASASTAGKDVTGVDRTSIGFLARSTDVGYLDDSDLDLIGVWDVALSGDEIKALADGVSPLLVRPTNLQCLWLMEGTGDEPDYSGNGNTMSAENSPGEADNAPTQSIFCFDQPSTVLVAAGGLALKKAIDDAVEVPDELARALTLNRALTHDVEIPDELARALTLNRALTHDIEIPDELARALTLNRALTHDIEIPDELARALTLVRGLDDDVEVPDELARALAMNRAIEDVVEIPDELGRITGLLRALDDDVETTDELGKVLGIVRAIDDDVEIPDETGRILGLVKALDDLIEITDELGRLGLLTRSLDDVIELPDETGRSMSLVRVLDDDLEIIEELGRVLTLSRGLDDTIEITEELNKALSIARSLDDDVELLDDLGKVLGLVRSIDDVVEISDELGKKLTVIGPSVIPAVLLKGVYLAVTKLQGLYLTHRGQAKGTYIPVTQLRGSLMTKTNVRIDEPIFAGDTYKLEITVYQDDDFKTIKDISGATEIKVTLSDYRDYTKDVFTHLKSLAEVSFVTDGTDGKFVTTYSTTETNNMMPAGKLTRLMHFEAEVTLGSEEKKVVEGIIPVHASAA